MRRGGAASACCGGYDLAFDMMIYSGQLGDALDLASALPDTQIIVNHTGSPADRDDDAIAAWRSGMSALAGAANVAVKISDLGAYDHNWTTESTRPFIRHTIDAFGTERCMFASDFPVAGLHGGADAVYSSFKTIVVDFPETEQRALFHDNAAPLSAGLAFLSLTAAGLRRRLRVARPRARARDVRRRGGGPQSRPVASPSKTDSL